MADDSPTRPRPKSRSTSKSRKTTTARSSDASDASTDASSATTSTNPPNVLGLEHDDWRPPEHEAPADVDLGDEYEPPPPELIDWTPERAGAIVRAGGFLLHTADGAAREPEGAELWKATQDDVEAIAPPLARILNRYAPARRLAGVSDEAELAIGIMSYTRRNLATRGRVMRAKREREDPAEPQVWTPDQPEP